MQNIHTYINNDNESVDDLAKGTVETNQIAHIVICR